MKKLQTARIQIDMMSWLLNIFYLVALACYIPLLFLKRKWHDRFVDRFWGRSRHSLTSNHQAVIWMHAVSVGEVMVLKPIIEAMYNRYDQVRIVCTVVTATGFEMAQKQLPSPVQIEYAPLDFSWAVKRFAASIKPDLYVAAETELWPNLFSALHAQSVPIIVINARISDKSFRQYRSVRWLLSSYFNFVDWFAVQSQQDQERLIAMGVNQQKIEVVGNIKFDMYRHFKNDFISRPAAWNKHKVLIAASTHPGEEALMLAVYQKLRLSQPDLRLIIAPRHIERADAVIDIVKGHGCFPYIYSQDLDRMTHWADDQVLVVDEIGRLMVLYHWSDVVFIGKTFRIGGGQNMIEPAVLAKPVIVGPRTENFKDVMRLFRSADAIKEINQEDQLSKSIETLLNDPQAAQELGQRAAQVVVDHQGASDRIVENMTVKLFAAMKAKATKHQDTDPFAKLEQWPLVIKSGFYGLAWLYKVLMIFRNQLFDLGVLKSVRLPKPVISVGNISVGGVGKTPLVADLCAYFLQNNLQPVILTRGYMPKQKPEAAFDESSMMSDEAQMLSEVLSGRVPVLINPKRVQAAESFLKSQDCDVFIMDDGFQHRHLQRDLDVVIVDPLRFVKNHHGLPAGPMREPVRALRRADMVILSKSEMDHSATEQTREVLKAYVSEEQILEMNHQPQTFVSVWNGTKVALDALSQKQAVLCAGIGDPATFQAMVEKINVNVVAMLEWIDHHIITESDIRVLIQLLNEHQTSTLICTHKDAVKLRTWQSLFSDQYDVYYLEIGIKFKDEQQKVKYFERIRSILY